MMKTLFLLGILCCVGVTSSSAYVLEDADQDIKRLENKFNVDDERIDKLGRLGLNYREVIIVLALAKQMNGGITDTNVDTVVQMRLAVANSGKKRGWSTIAQELGLTLKPVIDDLNELQEIHQGEEARSEEKVL